MEVKRVGVECRTMSHTPQELDAWQGAEVGKCANVETKGREHRREAV